VTVVSPASGSYEEAVVNDAPEAWWRLDESSGATVMADALGRHDGTYFGTPALGATGVGPGGDAAATFDGASYGSVPFAPALNSAVFSIECWVKTGDLSDTLVPVSSHYSGKGWYFQTAVPTAGQWAGGVAVGGSEYYVPSTTAADSMQSNVWTQLVITDDPNNGLLFFINGQWDGQAWADFDRNAGGPFIIGGLGSSSGQGPSSLWKGGVDEVSFYNYALTLDQVQAHYAAALYGGTTKPVFKLQPQSQSAVVGSTVTFKARVEGTLPINLQWWKGNAPIAGETTDTLTLTNVSSGSSGNYQLMATNSVGNAASTVATLTVLPVPSSVNLTNGLVLHLKFDNDLTDSSGLGNDGIAGGTPAFVAGHVGSGAVSLNTDTAQGIANYVSLPVTNSLNFGANDSFSISMWINYTNMSGDLPMIGNASGSTYQVGWVFASDAGQFEWTLVATDNTSVIADPVGGPGIDDGTWHNVIVSVDRSVGVVNTYVDGTQIGTREIQGLGSLNNGFAITLGQDPSGLYDPSRNGTFKGGFLIDDLGI
ncbi:MAG TPA: LamG-like jellyroll fold domain-containing protein, partial [Verrucomicrobiae bacterium]|nr:LamG-like jellyroll fold domain-containing protein [Verrucomicrobiae bacterium]